MSTFDRPNHFIDEPMRLHRFVIEGPDGTVVAGPFADSDEAHAHLHATFVDRDTGATDAGYRVMVEQRDDR